MQAKRRFGKGKRRILLLALALVALAGILGFCCYQHEPAPQAPPLQPRGEPYVNEKDGFRFDPPAEWHQRSHALSSGGEGSEGRLLVRYKLLRANKPIFLRVSVAELPDSAANCSGASTTRGA